MIGSTAQRQSEYRQRLKLINPELLRERERRKWHRRQMRGRLASHSSTLRNTVEASPFAIGMKHQDIRNYNNRLQPDDVKRLNSVKYPIHDLLRWLENVEVNDKVKYRFLKYIYNEKDRPSSRRNGNSDASQHERWRDRPNEVQLDYDNDKKRIPAESSSESGLDDMLSANRTQFKNPERRVKPHRRKYNNKTTSKKATKQAPKRKKTGVKGCEQIVWEPLLFDNDDSDENDERSAGRQY